MAQDRVEAVERALAMLDAFAPELRALSLTELAERTDLYKSTVLRLAKVSDRMRRSLAASCLSSASAS